MTLSIKSKDKIMWYAPPSGSAFALDIQSGEKSLYKKFLRSFINAYGVSTVPRRLCDTGPLADYEPAHQVGLLYIAARSVLRQKPEPKPVSPALNQALELPFVWAKSDQGMQDLESGPGQTALEMAKTLAGIGPQKTDYLKLAHVGGPEGYRKLVNHLSARCVWDMDVLSDFIDKGAVFVERQPIAPLKELNCTEYCVVLERLRTVATMVRKRRVMAGTLPQDRPRSAA